ncbi:MAG: tetratricopeptide repeat protein, partial [Planctomycetota bacterium]
MKLRGELCEPVVGRPVHVGRWLRFWVLLAVFMTLSTCVSVADEQTEDEAKIATGRFVQVLLRNPRPGTAFDKVYSFHIDRGSIVAFRENLRVAANLPDSMAPQSGEITDDMVVVDIPANADPAACCMILGLIDLKHSESDSALAALQQAIVLRPKDPIAHWMLARAFNAAQKPEEAIASLEAAIGNRPSKTDLLEIYKELARNLQRAQRTDDALNAWKRLEAAFPGDLRVQEQIASTLVTDGRWDEALTRYIRLAAESEDPDLKISANLSASDAMLQLGRGQEAISLLESQLENLDPDGWVFRDIRRRIESIFRDRNDLAGLVSYYDAWVNAHPEDVDAMARLARTLSLQNRTTEALDWYRKAISVAPANVSLRESLIEQLVRDNHRTDAIAQYAEMSQFDEGNQDHIEKWGLLIFRQNDVPLAVRQAEAASVWERMLANRPDDPLTMARLAGLLRQAELSDRAIQMYRSAIEKAPEDPQYREYLGEYLCQLERVDEAIAEWKLMADGDRRSKANLIRLAEVLNRFNLMELASGAMREACSMNPTPIERVQFAELLRNRSGTHETATPQNAAGNDRIAANSAMLNEAIEQLDSAEQSAETPDERQQILKERIQCLVAAGQLEQQIDLLLRNLATATDEADSVGTAERWRLMALYQDAAEDKNEATAAALKVVEIQPESIPGWTLLADLYERTGRLGDAADAMRKLALLDRRGTSEYLRRTARLQVRLGQFNAALDTGRDVIKATPGNPEAYQFFADLAFEVGQPEAAVASLRQAVRVNPGDEGSLKALAKTLADEFQTSEAIELYWRAFEKAPDLESQTQIVVALSNLYLRSSQFSRLIERLELRGREFNLPTEMTRCIAIAYREAGDFRTARVNLERLRGDGINDDILLELLALARAEHNEEQAAAIQKQIIGQNTQSTSQNGGDESLVAEGALPESPAELLNQIRQPRDEDDLESRAEACREYLSRFPDDWSVLATLATILSKSGQHAEAAVVARRVTTMSIRGDATGTISDLGTPDRKGSRDPFRSHLNGLRHRFQINGDTFIAAWCRCCDILLLANEASQPSLVPVLLSKENMDRFSDVPFWFVSGHVTEESLICDEILKHTQKLSATGDWSPGRRLTYFLREMDLRIRFRRANDSDLDSARQTVLKQLPGMIINEPDIIRRYPIVGCVWQLFHDKPAMVEQLILELGNCKSKTPNPESRAAIAAFAWVFADADLFEKAAEIPPPTLASPEGVFSTVLESILSGSEQHHAGMNTTPLRNPQLMTRFAEIATRHAAVPVHVEDSIQQSLKNSFDHEDRRQDWLNTLIDERSFRVVLPSDATQGRSGETARKAWHMRLLNNDDPLFRARTHLILAESFDADAQLHLVKAAELLPTVPGLQFEVAVEAARAGLWLEAVALLDLISVTDTGERIEIESRALEWSLSAGSRERARLAAKRLFGLPMNQSQQMQLASRLSQLGLSEELASLNARLGRGSETRQSVLGRKLQTYMAQGNEQLAGEVSWELLKLASGGTLFSGVRPNDDRDDGGERLQAIRALGKMKRLQPLIERYEAMLDASPDSLDLLEILCEFHEAAEQFPQLAEKRDRIALLSKKTPPGLKAKAVALENSGDVNGACDIYLQILKDDPGAFAEEMETHVQAFERARRHAEFLQAVLSLDRDLWSGNAALLVNVTADLARMKSDDGVVKQTVEVMLANESTRRIALGGFLARPGVIAESQLLSAIAEELKSDTAFESYTSANEIFLILQGLQQESSLRSLLDTIVSWRTEQHQPAGTVQDDAAVSRDFEVPEGSNPLLAKARDELILVFLNARLGDRAAVEKQLTGMFVDVAPESPSSGLSATFSPSGDKGKAANALSSIDGDAVSQRGPDGFLSIKREQDFRTLRLMVFAMNARLKDMGAEWVNSRRIVLEWMLNQPPSEQEDFDSLADSLIASDDAVLEELGTVYELLGDSVKSRAIMNRRIRALIANSRLSGEGSGDAIRQLLHAGEKIQASGFPIEGTQLLLNVTQHEIDQFTKDLDSDKGIAFKSRFNASLRWSKQQITAQKIVSWLGMNVAEMTSESQQEKKSADLLLELNGVTDLKCRDREQLKQLRVQSTLLAAIEKQDFSGEDLVRKIDDATDQLLTIDVPPMSLLAVAAAIADRRQKLNQLESVFGVISRRLDDQTEPQRDSPASP